MSGSNRSVVLLSEPASPRRARAFLRRVLADAPEDVRERAALGASELVANVVLHTDCHTLTLTVSQDPRGLRVEVRDDSPRPVIYREPDTKAQEGRGLQILDSLFSSWGVSWGDGPGKSVWFRLEMS